METEKSLIVAANLKLVHVHMYLGFLALLGELSMSSRDFNKSCSSSRTAFSSRSYSSSY